MWQSLTSNVNPRPQVKSGQNGSSVFKWISPRAVLSTPFSVSSSEQSTMNRLVLTLTSMLTFWLLCSDCAPVLPKPINATRKITHSSTPTTAAVVATTAASITQQTLASQSVAAKPSESIRPEKLPSSLSQLSRPEFVPQSISTESTDRNASSPRNGEGITVNVIVSPHYL